jgi:hypothetical protein
MEPQISTKFDFIPDLYQNIISVVNNDFLHPGAENRKSYPLNELIYFEISV